jgi:hypothetical protein
LGNFVARVEIEWRKVRNQKDLLEISGKSEEIRRNLAKKNRWVNQPGEKANTSPSVNLKQFALSSWAIKTNSTRNSRLLLLSSKPENCQITSAM